LANPLISNTYHFSLGSANDFNDLAMGLVRFGHFWGVFGE
jgi:hypothetical protein